MILWYNVVFYIYVKLNKDIDMDNHSKHLYYLKRNLITRETENKKERANIKERNWCYRKGKEPQED